MRAPQWPTPRTHEYANVDAGNRPQLGLDTGRLHSAFPRTLQRDASVVGAVFGVAHLLPTYGRALVLGNEAVAVPRRVYNPPPTHDDFSSLTELQQVMTLAVAARHHDGHVREDAVRQLVERDEPWLGTFLLLCLGDPVMQVVEPIASALDGADPGATTLREILASTAAQNPVVFRTVRSQARGYWHTYYQGEHPSWTTYPGVRACAVVADSVGKSALLGW